MSTRAFLRANISTLIDTFDAHEAGIGGDGIYICQCKWQGTPADWEAHLAEKLADKLETATSPVLETGKVLN